MSDRAAVMKKFNKDFLSFIQSELGQQTLAHFLYCNAHFHLGLSGACEAELKPIEKSVIEMHAEKLGRYKHAKFFMFSSTESATSRVIRMASELTGPRGDEKNGCREEWLAYVEERDKDSIMPDGDM